MRTKVGKGERRRVPVASFKTHNLEKPWYRVLPGNACIEGYPCSKHETAVTKMDTLKSDSQLQLMYIKSVMIYSSKYERRKKRSPGGNPRSPSHNDSSVARHYTIWKVTVAQLDLSDFHDFLNSVIIMRCRTCLVTKYTFQIKRAYAPVHTCVTAVQLSGQISSRHVPIVK